MTKQLYDVQIKEEIICIIKNGSVIYSISVNDKSINLKELYDKMAINIDDEMEVQEDFKKIEDPKNDTERVYNNTIDFVSRLLFSVNEKLLNLRARPANGIFE